VKFTIEASELARVVETAAKGAGNSRSVRVLGGLRLEASGGTLAVCGTDLDVAVFARAKYRTAPGKTGDRVAVVDPAAQLVKATKTLQGDVTVETDESQLQLRAGRTVLTFDLYTAVDFPAVADDGDSHGSFPTASTFGLFESVRHAYSREESRPVLTGVQLRHASGALTLAATDSYRLSVAALKSELDEVWDVIVPGSGLALAQKLLGKTDRVELAERRTPAGHRWFGVKADHASVWMRAIDGQFPSWRQLLPDYASSAATVTFSRAEALTALKRVSALQVGHAPVALIATPGEPLRIRLDQADAVSVTDEIDADVQHAESLTIAFNPPFLVDALAALDDDDVTMTAISGMRPAVLRGATAEPWHLLMPVRVSDSTPNAQPAQVAA
jgi:DNA polymerase-3 subunit beta